jgi:hypothetical protein
VASSLAFSPVSVAASMARPSSAAPYIGAMGGSSNSSSSAAVGDVAAGYAAGFAAAQQSLLGARRSVVSVHEQVQRFNPAGCWVAEQQQGCICIEACVHDVSRDHP